MSKQENAWDQLPLSDIFRIGREQVIPSQQPKAIFTHYSIPAWDEFGGPAFDLGETIESNKTSITGPSVLVSKLNPRKPRVAVIEAPDTRTCCSTEFICYQPRRAGENLRFWGMYLHSQEFSARLARVAIGSTNSHTRASPRETLGWLVPSVPLAEQDVIAQILDTLGTAIRETEALIDKLKAVKQGLLHDLLTRGIDANGQLRPPQSEAPHLYKESPLGWIPWEWEVTPLSEACTHIVDCPHSTPHFQDEGVLVARTMHIKNGDFFEKIASRVSTREYSERIARLEPNPGDLIFTREAPVGEAFVIPEGMQICLGQRVMLLRPQADKLISKYFLAQIYSGSVKDRIALLTSGTTNPHLNVSEVKRFEIPLPSLNEQALITDGISSLDNSIQYEQSKLEKLLHQKSGLMDDLLTGRVRVTPLLESPPLCVQQMVQQPAAQTGA